MTKNSFFQCKQGSCCRELIGLDKFRQHLKRHHSSTDLDDPVNNTNISLHTTEADFLQELSIDVSHSSVTSLNSCNYTNLNSNLKLDYELSEEAILLNELASTTHNSDSKKDNMYKNKVEKSVLIFISKLASKPNVTSSLLQEIICGVEGIFSCGIISDIKHNVMPILNKINEHKKSEIENMFDALENAFSQVKTEYHRTNFFLKNNLFFKPETVIIGYTNEKKND